MSRKVPSQVNPIKLKRGNLICKINNISAYSLSGVATHNDVPAYSLRGVDRMMYLIFD